MMCKTLVVHDEDDPNLKWQDSQRIVEAMPGRAIYENLWARTC